MPVSRGGFEQSYPNDKREIAPILASPWRSLCIACGALIGTVAPIGVGDEHGFGRRKYHFTGKEKFPSLAPAFVAVDGGDLPFFAFDTLE